MDGGPGLHRCTCSLPSWGLPSTWVWWLWKGSSIEAAGCGVGSQLRHGSKLLLCWGVGVDAQGSYRGE